MTLSPQSVRAELVEALFCLSTSKEKERPFDKLRANGERGQPWYVALHAAIALHVSDPPATVQPLAPLAIWPMRCTVSPAASSAAVTSAASSGATPTAIPIDRKGVVSGKSVSVRVDLGGRSILKKN